MRPTASLLALLLACAGAGAGANDTRRRDRFANASPARWAALGEHKWNIPEAGRAARQERIRSALQRLGFEGEEAEAAQEAPALATELASLRGNPVLLEVARREGAPSLLGGLAGAAAMGFEAMMTMTCIMCEYIMEVADRNIKSMPHWAHGGSGNFVGMTDFNAGNQQGSYRAYSGQYLQLDAGVTGKRGSHPAPVGSGIPESVHPSAVRQTPRPASPTEAAMRAGEWADERNAHAEAALESSKRLYMARDSPLLADNLHTTSHRIHGDETNFAPFKDYGHPRQARPLHSALMKHGPRRSEVGGPTPPRNRFPSLLQTAERQDGVDGGVDGGVDAAAAEPEAGAAPTDGEHAAGLMTMPPRSPMRGRRTFRDFNRLDSVAEKDMEYSQMFDDVMDQFDDICQHDLPAKPDNYKKHCKVPYRNAEYLVELYLHGYEDYEICTKILACAPNFFESA